MVIRTLDSIMFFYSSSANFRQRGFGPLFNSSFMFLEYGNRFSYTSKIKKTLICQSGTI